MLAFVLALCALPLLSSAQTVVNGQIFTYGLAIVDAPQPQSTFHAGANMPIAIDVSGNGRLKSEASVPGSDLDTRFDSLEIFLVSSQTHLNLTISQGAGLLKGEVGSTVKHLDFQLSRCISAGNYNVTFYEAYHLEGAPHFSITSLPVTIENTGKEGNCGSNDLQEQPQTSSAPSRSPWLSENGTIVSFPDNAAVAAGIGSGLLYTLVGALVMLVL